MATKDLPRRRSSVKNLQVQDELRSIDHQHVFKGCPLLQNLDRLSGNTTRNSWNKQRPGGSGAGFARGGGGASNIPTPSSGGRGRGRPSSATRNMTALSAGSRARSTSSSSLTGPRAGPSAGAGSGARPAFGSSQPRATGFQPRGAGGGGGGGMAFKPPGALPRALSVTSLSGTLNTTKRRSKSYESLSLLQTPAFTPAGRSRSRSPGSAMSAVSTARRRGGVINDAGDQGKGIKIVKDNKIHAEMAKYIFEFLDVQGCQSKPTGWKDLMNPPKISGATFTSMVKFLGSHFVGEIFFATAPANAKPSRGGDDALEKILELSKVLKYPGQITKSNLKTATAQHAWPTCLAFLAWLCCRTNCLVNPPQERTGIDELASNGMQEYAFESYLNLFPAHFNRVLTQELVDEELENFKARVREADGVELVKTRDELIQDRDEKKMELEQLQNIVDPSKEFRDRHTSELQVQTELQERIKEVETKCKSYSNTNHLVLQLERLELEITARMEEISKLKKQVQSQALSKEDASIVINETEMLKVQLASLVRVNEQLQSEYEGRTRKVAEFRKDLYELCTTFSVVERYNEVVRFLHLDDLVIAPNPFATKELEEWMKVASKTLRRAEAKVKDMVHQVEFSSDQKTKETMEYQQQIDNLQEQVTDLKSKLQSAERYNKFLSADLEKKYNVDLANLSEVTAALHEEEGELNRVLQCKEGLGKSQEEWTKCVEGYRGTVAEWKEKLQVEMEKFALEMTQANQFILTTIEDAARRQQDFYQQHFGIDIFEQDEDDSNNSNANTTG